MDENIRFSKIDGRDGSIEEQLSSSARELYMRRMVSLASLSNSKIDLMAAEFSLRLEVDNIVQTDPEWPKQKNPQARDSYLSRKLSYSIGLVQSNKLSVEYRRTAYELARMSLSETRLQIDIMRMFTNANAEQFKVEEEDREGVEAGVP